MQRLRLILCSGNQALLLFPAQRQIFALAMQREELRLQRKDLRGSASDQKVSFTANCNSLGFGLNAVAVTTPNVCD